MSEPPNQQSQVTEALLERIFANTRDSRFDLPSFIARRAELDATSRILDVGAGTGAVLCELAARLGPSGQCVALDQSESSLERLKQHARTESLSVRTVCENMDRLNDPNFEPELTGLTHIFGVYALYYSESPVRLLESLAERLADSGALIVVGPAPGNNSEWFELLRSAGMTLPQDVLDVSERFLPDVVESFGRRFFRDLLIDEARNAVRFASTAALTRYYRSTTYYDPNTSEAVGHSIRRLFEQCSGFTVTKRIRLVRMRQTRQLPPPVSL